MSVKTNLTREERREIFIPLKERFEDEAAKNVYMFMEQPEAFTRWKNARLFQLAEDYRRAIDQEEENTTRAAEKRIQVMKPDHPGLTVDPEDLLFEVTEHEIDQDKLKASLDKAAGDVVGSRYKIKVIDDHEEVPRKSEIKPKLDSPGPFARVIARLFSSGNSIIGRSHHTEWSKFDGRDGNGYQPMYCKQTVRPKPSPAPPAPPTGYKPCSVCGNTRFVKGAGLKKDRMICHNCGEDAQEAYENRTVTV